MDDYIKREDAKNLCKRICALHGECSVDDVINSLPTADVRENVYGAWDWKITGKAESGGTLGKARCSECKAITWATATDGKLNFCPNCGADMRGMIDLNHKYALLEDGTIEPLWYSDGEQREAYLDEDGYFYLDHDRVIEYEGAFGFAFHHNKIIATSDEERYLNGYRTYTEENDCDCPN